MPRRDGWPGARSPRSWLVVGGALTLLVALAVPVLGVSLLVLVALDVAAGRVRRRRAQRLSRSDAAV